MPSSSPAPLFSPGSVVRVLPDTTPGVRPMHAEGMLMATFWATRATAITSSLRQEKKGRLVLGILLVVEVHDQLTSLTITTVSLLCLVCFFDMYAHFLSHFGMSSVIRMCIVQGMVRAFV